MEQLGLGEVESSGTTYAMTVGRSLIPRRRKTGWKTEHEWSEQVVSVFFFLQNVYVTSAKNVHLFDKTSLLFLISSLHIILSVVNGERFLLSSVDCLVKGSDPKSFKTTASL